MPVDALLTPFRTQLIHSKITVTRTSLPLAMNLLWIFFIYSTLLFLIRNEEEERKENKIEVTNSKSNYERFHCNQ